MRAYFDGHSPFRADGGVSLLYLFLVLSYILRAARTAVGCLLLHLLFPLPPPSARPAETDKKTTCTALMVT